jgi:hypothetical protein
MQEKIPLPKLPIATLGFGGFISVGVGQHEKGGRGERCSAGNDVLESAFDRLSPA